MSKYFLLQWRESLLQLLDTIERELNISPRTAELRKTAKEQKRLEVRAGSDTITVTG